MKDLVVAVVPTETGNGIDQRSSVEDILNCEETVLYALTDYFKAQNDEDLPLLHWSFLINQRTKTDLTGANIVGVHQSLRTAQFVKEVTLTDPDTKGDVELSVYKHMGGGMFAMDSSFLDQCVNTDDYDRPIIPDPFSDNGVEDGMVSHVVLFD
jgi:hypothetical protein